MKLILSLISILLFSPCFANKKNVSEKSLTNKNYVSSNKSKSDSLPEEIKVTVSEDEILRKGDRYNISYSSEIELCKITWDAMGNKNQAEWTMRLRLGSSDHCPEYEKQVKTHKAILDQLFAKHLAQNLTSFISPPLEVVQTDGSWNVTLARAASVDEDWIEYSKDYPNHKSGKTSNLILVELADEIELYEPLKNLLNPYDIKIKLKSVEKVFAQKVSALSFRSGLEDVKFDKSLAYDAGMWAFKVNFTGKIKKTDVVDDEPLSLPDDPAKN